MALLAHGNIKNESLGDKKWKELEPKFSLQHTGKKISNTLETKFGIKKKNLLSFFKVCTFSQILHL